MTIGDDGIASIDMGKCTDKKCPAGTNVGWPHRTDVEGCINFKPWRGDETGPKLITAIEATFGPIAFDLACTRENCKGREGLYHPQIDALSVDWATYLDGELGWLNPPIIPNPDTWDWTAKCALEAEKGARILLIAEAALDTAAFWQHMWPHAAIHILHPRMNYDGRNVPLMLVAYNVDPLPTACPALPPPQNSLNLWLWNSNLPLVLAGLK